MPGPLSSLLAVLRRFGCTPAEAAAVCLLAAGTLASVGLLWVLSRPPAGTLPPTGQPVASDSPEATLGVTAAEVVVHVAGAVRRPGLYTLPGGSRVADAVEAAGGPRRKAVLDALNLAAVLTDGEQLLVPTRSTAAGPSTPGGATTSGPSSQSKVDLNAATPADLEQLPGIGPVLASRIVDHRDSIGGFTEIGQLRDVPGIGEKTFQALAELVSL